MTPTAPPEETTDSAYTAPEQTPAVTPSEPISEPVYTPEEAPAVEPSNPAPAEQTAPLSPEEFYQQIKEFADVLDRII